MIQDELRKSSKLACLAHAATFRFRASTTKMRPHLAGSTLPRTTITIAASSWTFFLPYVQLSFEPASQASFTSSATGHQYRFVRTRLLAHKARIFTCDQRGDIQNWPAPYLSNFRLQILPLACFARPQSNPVRFLFSSLAATPS